MFISTLKASFDSEKWRPMKKTTEQLPQQQISPSPHIKTSERTIEDPALRLTLLAQILWK
jgi:hypothetical protein